MTAKEKAKHLVKRFTMLDVIVCDPAGNEIEGYIEQHAKQCALMMVDEIMSNTNAISNFYWRLVKREINSL